MIAILGGLVALLALCLKLQYLWVDGIPRCRKSAKKRLNWLQRILFHSVGSFVLDWNDYKLKNLEAVDEVLNDGRSCLLLGYHSRATVDILYVMCMVQPKLIVTYLFFTVPVVRELVTMLGFIPSKSPKSISSQSDDAFVEHLSQSDDPVMLLPGGLLEALKTYDQRHQLLWKDLPGYARVLESRVHGSEWKTKGLSVVPFYTKNSEELYLTTSAWYDYSAMMSKHYYDEFKTRGNLMVLPLMLTFMMFCLGFVLYPRPVQLDTVFGEPIHWKTGESGKSFNARVVKSLTNLIEITNRKNCVRRRRPRNFLSHVHHILLTSFVVIQNAFFALFGLLMIWSTFLPCMILSFLQLSSRSRSTTKNS